jgi:undecaprenyl-diphosphatase
MSLLQAIILAIIEGITEFLPISSTGHMIIGSWLMHIEKNQFVKLFTVAIQFGAILSVFVLYFKRFFRSIDFYFKLAIGFVPAIIAGLLLNDLIDALLENIPVVGFALIIGGLFLVFVDTLFAKNEFRSNQTEGEKITYLKAFIIGVFQCLAMVPGVSRSASTIVGGLTQKLNRKTAAEFSFFLAVPTMFAATAKKMWDAKDILKVNLQEHLTTLVIGNVIAFVVAMIAIKFFITVLTKYGFKWFGFYRILAGGALLALYYSGVKMELI